MKKIKIIICLMLFMFCINVKADECTTDEMNRLKELASNVEIIKNLEIKKDNQYDDLVSYYTIKISNLNDDLNIFYDEGSQKKLINSENVNDFSFRKGTTATFYVYAYTNNSCINKLLRTITVKFEDYNLYYYSNKDKCNKYPDFKYCQEYMDTSDKTYEEIDELFDEYIKEESKSTGYSNEELYYIIGGIFLFCLVVFIINTIVKTYKKNKL